MIDIYYIFEQGEKMTLIDQLINDTYLLNKPIIREGATGEIVKELQRLLKKYRIYSGIIDGIYGTETVGGIILFQYRVFLPEDGIVGQKTWQALYKGSPVDLPTLQLGSQGKLVKALQQRLYIAGEYRHIFDGEFGQLTEVAVKSFQRRHKLTIDGIVGDRTWVALSNIDVFGG